MPFNHPKPLPEIDLVAVRRYRLKVKEKGPDECWPWLACSDKDGYGKMTVRTHDVRAIRVGYKIHYGVDPMPDLILHSCDHSWCHNPTHWRSGSVQDNVIDRDERGRTSRGATHWTNICPDRIARGDRSGSRTHPERRPRGSDHWLRKHPELVKRGEQVKLSKLKAEDVLAIRHLASSGTISQRKLAIQFGVYYTTISKIVTRKTWKHVQ